MMFVCVGCAMVLVLELGGTVEFLGLLEVVL